MYAQICPILLLASLICFIDSSFKHKNPGRPQALNTNSYTIFLSKLSYHSPWCLRFCPSWIAWNNFVVGSFQWWFSNRWLVKKKNMFSLPGTVLKIFLTAEKIRKMKLLVDSGCPKPPIGAILGQRLSTEFQLIDHPDHAYFALHLRTPLAGHWLTNLDTF